MVKATRLHQAPITQIAKDFGISAMTLYEWMRTADINDGARPGITSNEDQMILATWVRFPSPALKGLGLVRGGSGER